MQLLKELAHQGGKTVILVTHATANITEGDRIVFLDLGGRLCYFGTPQEALNYFGVSDFADIYIKLDQEQAVIKYALPCGNAAPTVLIFQLFIPENHQK